MSSNSQEPKTYLQCWICPNCNEWNDYPYKSYKFSKYIKLYECESCDYKHPGKNLDVPNGFEIITHTESTMDGWGRDFEYTESLMITQCPKCGHKQITTELRNPPPCKQCGTKFKLSLGEL